MQSPFSRADPLEAFIHAKLIYGCSDTLVHGICILAYKRRKLLGEKNECLILEF